VINFTKTTAVLNDKEKTVLNDKEKTEKHYVSKFNAVQ